MLIMAVCQNQEELVKKLILLVNIKYQREPLQPTWIGNLMMR
jgi:hypothetical protein